MVCSSFLGKIEAGETPEDCALRELKEETGLSLEKTDIYGRIAPIIMTIQIDVFAYLWSLCDKTQVQKMTMGIGFSFFQQRLWNQTGKQKYLRRI